MDASLYVRIVISADGNTLILRWVKGLHWQNPDLHRARRDDRVNAREIYPLKESIVTAI